MTVHGKLDRKALPDVNFEPQALQYVAPRTPVEETVAAIFDDLLGTSTVGVNDDFFCPGWELSQCGQVGCASEFCSRRTDQHS